MLDRCVLIYLLLGFMTSEVLPHQTIFWKHMIQQLNNFRRIKAVDLKIADMQKIYWDGNLETLARQKIETFYHIRFTNVRSMCFWIETIEKDHMKRTHEFFLRLTMDAHREDRLTEAVWNAPFNLAINGDTIRIGCAEAEVYFNSTKSIVMLCVFGPNPVLLNDRLYTHGSPCEHCPAQTGCEDNLCDEKIKAGLPPMVDILGVRMSENSHLTISIALVFSMFFIVFALMAQYFS
ncbi:hypothetical protein B9Z55_010633 [Caenorhabditis nigoni]|uniref:SCP domain-containing protein n=1 Tax=Caenorhabditis nigoni TaxID=1611254 RepID=A0A2G5UH02_9PELO|nr:hypothetical protein B9Z55_010633 [Caenorhabditis nigoni]